MSMTAEWAIYRAYREQYTDGLDAMPAMNGAALAARCAISSHARGSASERRSAAEQAKALREWAQILRKAADYVEMGDTPWPPDWKRWDQK